MVGGHVEGLVNVLLVLPISICLCQVIRGKEVVKRRGRKEKKFGGWRSRGREKGREEEGITFSQTARGSKPSQGAFRVISSHRRTP